MTSAAPPTERWGAHTAAPAGRTLAAMLEAERLPHALLIAGPSGVGKRDLAIRIAQALLCDDVVQSGDGIANGPCRACRSCLRLHDPNHPHLEPQHPDVEVITPGSLCAVSDHDHVNTRTIGICVVRRVEHASTLAPFEAPRRIFIIDPADSLTADAADAILKTLEEPPERVHFILVSAREAQLSETIRSRCRTLTLSPLPTAQLDIWLEQWAADADQALPGDADKRDELGRLARGRPGWLQTNLQGGDPIGQRAAQIDDAIRIARASRSERLDWCEQLVGRGATPQAIANLDLLLEAWIDWWRDLWLWQNGQTSALIHCSQRERIAEHAALYDQQHLSQFLEQIERARALIGRGVNARLALDVLLLSIPVAREHS